jgi:class 3 adenylate cyclase/tetratricopeptide (TPR) repeat protein
MTFEEVLDQAIDMLRRRGRLTYRALKRQFNLDEAYLEDLTEELIKGQRLAADEDGDVLVWLGAPPTSPEPVPASPLAGALPAEPPGPGTPEALPAAQTTALDDTLDRLQRYLPSHLSEKILASRGRLEGERKIVTVLFADLAGYTTLSEHVGEEVMFALMDDLYELFIHEVHQYEGTVNELTGDGIVAFFGAPLAVEQAPQRAVWAALSMQRALARYSVTFARAQGHRLQLRVGLNTGPVIVGTVGNNLRMDYKAVGDTVNLAARMEQTAEPGTVRITGNTYKLVEGYFRCEDLGLVEVKGKAARVQVYRVTGEKGARSRMDIERERGLTRFIGRERELELLRDCFERARDGRGQAFSIIGEAGLGKSRLLYEFRKALAGEEVTFLEGHCHPYGAAVAYLPIVDLLKHNFRIEASDSGTEIIRKVESGLRRLGIDLEATAPYLLQLLAAEVDRGPVATLPPEVVKRRTFEALRRLALTGAEMRPLVLAIEDLHWADKTSEEYATFLLDQIAGARVLLLFTYRPDFVSTWSGKSYHSAVTLVRLSNRESHQMLTSLLGTDQVQDELIELVLDKSEGVPFFLEELVKSLRETGAIVLQDGHWALTAEAMAFQVPDTVHDVLMTRIDRLPDGAKRVLQIGAVMGREFPFELLKAVGDLPEPELLAHLSALKDAELIYERGIYPQTTYFFKHAFTQDVAYDSLLLAARRRLHQQIGHAILARHEDNLEEWASLLAHHFAHGENVAQALPYLVQTGERAQRVYANAEAVRTLTQALEIVDALPTTEDTRRQRTDLTLRLASLHALLGHYSDSLALYARALENAKTGGDTSVIARLEMRVGRTRYEMGDYEGAITDLQGALERAQGLHDATRMAVCYQSLGDVFFSSGSLPKAIECYMNALRLSEEVGNHMGVAAACTFLCNAHARAGNLEEAVGYGQRALTLGEQMHDDRRIAWACIMLAQAYYYVGESAETALWLERAQQLCEKIGDYRGISWATSSYFQVAELAKDFERAVASVNIQISRGIASGGFQHEVSSCFARGAAFLLRLGRYQEAFEYCQKGLAISLKTANRLEYGYAYMVLAELHASEMYRNWDKAAWYLEESLKAFREVGAQIDVGRAHLTGARIAMQRQDGSARQWAETARDIFAERGAKVLLQEAEELLATLA